MKNKISLGLSDFLALSALIISGLSYIESRAANSFAKERVRYQNLLVLKADDVNSDHIIINTVNEDQVIQAMWFYFPKEIRRSEVMLNAESPELKLSWIDYGIKNDLKGDVKQGFVSVINGQVPVGITTAYVVDGETVIDCSFYKIAYRASVPSNAEIKNELLGLALVERGVACGQLESIIESSWGDRVNEGL